MRPPAFPLLTGGVALTAAISLGVFGALGVAQACSWTPPDDTANLSLELAPGVTADFAVNYYGPSDPENPDDKGFCSAGISMPLSAFPSLGNRLGTDAVAAAIEEATKAMEIENCSIWVSYVNDVEADFTSQELCVSAIYGYSSGSRWSIESESYCWDEIDEIGVVGDPETLDEELIDYAD